MYSCTWCVVALLAFCCVVAVHANRLSIYSSPSDHRYFAFNTPAYATFGVYMQPCSQQDCCGKDVCIATDSIQPLPSCSGHAYCGTDSADNCLDNTDETTTVSVLLGFQFACCWDNDLSSGSTECGTTGGLVGGWITTPFPAVTFALPYRKCFDYPTTDASSAQSWQFLNSTDLNTLIQPLCGSGTKGWTLALSQSYNRAVALPAVADITWVGNNRVDVLFFYGHFGISTNRNSLVPVADSTALASSWNGPSAGIQGGQTCTPTENGPLPTVNPSAQFGCTAQCGCLLIDLLNKTWTGTVSAPSTTYTFQLCILCEVDFSQLQVCNADALPASIGGGICSYSVSNLTKTGCQTLKWAAASAGCLAFLTNGGCDILTVTLQGPFAGYVLSFEGYAGTGGTTARYPVTIDTSVCTCGSRCLQTTPPATATAPCPDRYSAGPNCDDCIFTDGSTANQAWCKPDGSGGYVWRLEPPSATPQPPSSQGWYKPGTVDGNGYQLGCSCQKKIIPCTSDCSGGNCVCNTATGVCVANPVCNIVTIPPASGSTCAACPKDSDGNECSNRGVCNCGTCVCGLLNGVNYTGVACDLIAGCPQYTDCASCRTAGASLGCTWCTTGLLSARCLPDAGCAADVGRDVDCSGAVVFTENPCPNNCSGNGWCSTTNGNTSITQCICRKGYHGADCSARGGLNASTKSVAISGGIIAAIVIAGVLILVLIIFAVWKGLDCSE